MKNQSLTLGVVFTKLFFATVSSKDFQLGSGTNQLSDFLLMFAFNGMAFKVYIAPADARAILTNIISPGGEH